MAKRRGCSRSSVEHGQHTFVSGWCAEIHTCFSRTQTRRGKQRYSRFSAGKTAACRITPVLMCENCGMKWKGFARRGLSNQELTSNKSSPFHWMPVDAVILGRSNSAKTNTVVQSDLCLQADAIEP